MDTQTTPTSQPRTCARWDVLDLAFETPKAVPDPFGVTFGAVFHGPEGAELRVPGFYDGGRSFVLRFSPPAEGHWTFETYASLPALAGRRGAVEAQPPTDPERHGPVVIDPERPQCLAYADGTPYVLLAFECDWLFALDLEDPDDLPRTRTLADQIAAHGFNHVVMNVYAHDVDWGEDPDLRPAHEFGSPPVYPFGGTNDDPDFSTLNVAFFRHLDRVVRVLDARGLVAHLMIYVWNKEVAWPPMYSEADDRYFDYVIARYQAFPNVVWDISKEALDYGRCDMAYVAERIRRARRQDAYGRLLTVHDYAYCAAHPETVDLISIQTWRTGLYHEMAAVRERHPHQPVLNIEHGGYEEGPYVVFPGDYVDPEVCLARNYACAFAGAYTTYYWQCAAWNVVIPDPMGLPEDQRPHFAYYRHMADLFARYDITTLTPEIRSSSGYALTAEDGRQLYLVPPENYALHITLDEAKEVRWFNPFTGEYRPQATATARPWHEFISPWPNQLAVLILTRA
jgi:hypothetical protein